MGQTSKAISTLVLRLQMEAEKRHSSTLPLGKEYLHIPKGALCTVGISEPASASTRGTAVVTQCS